MQSVNINEFYSGNIQFNIQSEDLKLLNAAMKNHISVKDEDWAKNPNNPNNWKTWQDIVSTSGEIAGYSEVGEMYFQDDRVDEEDSNFSDTTSLSDDNLLAVESKIVEKESGLTLHELFNQSEEYIDAENLEWKREIDLVGGRWGHIKDAHLQERTDNINTFWRLGSDSRPFGEMETMTRWRKNRYGNLLQYIDRCSSSKILREVQQEVWKRYLNSVKSIMVKVAAAKNHCEDCHNKNWTCNACYSKGDWWALYLTKHEVRQISDGITDKRQELRR